MKKFPMTNAGHLTLDGELKQRIRAERPCLVQRIRQAIAGGCRTRNQRGSYCRARRRALARRSKLSRAEVIDVSKLCGDVIKFGASVTLVEEDGGEEKVWQIVSEPEADVKAGRISVTSSPARALIGKAKAAAVEVEAPGGAKVYKIQKVRWPEGSRSLMKSNS